MHEYYVIHGDHRDPNDIRTLDKQTFSIVGPFDKIQADMHCKSVIQQNIDNYYHRAWVIAK